MEFFAVVWVLISSIFVFVCYTAFALILLLAIGGATFIVVDGIWTLCLFGYNRIKRLLKK